MQDQTSEVDVQLADADKIFRSIKVGLWTYCLFQITKYVLSNCCCSMYSWEPNFQSFHGRLLVRVMGGGALVPTTQSLAMMLPVNNTSSQFIFWLNMSLLIKQIKYCLFNVSCSPFCGCLDTLIHHLKLRAVYPLCFISTGIALETLAGVISLASSEIDHSLVSL